MTQSIKLQTEELFSAEGTSLKITKNCGTPFEIQKGKISIVHQKLMTKYEIVIQQEQKRRALPLKPSADIKPFKCQTRVEQFTLTFYGKTTSSVLCGSLKDEETTKKFVRLLEVIYKKPSGHNQKQTESKPKINLNARTPPIHSGNRMLDSRVSQVSASDPTWKSKANLKENRGETYRSRMKISKQHRKPLVQVDGKNNAGLFPSPSALKSSGSELNQRDKDCEVTAIGIRKSIISNFYNRTKVPKPNAENFLRFKSDSLKAVFPKFKKDSEKKISKTTIEEKSSPEVVGFANLGNTCYMNAILQCLLNIPNFYQELRNNNNVELVEHSSLYYRLCNLGYLKHSQELMDQKVALEHVKCAISNAAKRFSGYSQHDAHEFLCQCLDQLKEDLESKLNEKKQDSTLSDDEWNSLFACPTKENFETTVVHSIKCLSCNEEIVKEEICYDFSLVIPDTDENYNATTLNINTLLKLHFLPEKIDYVCENDGCDGEKSVLSHYLKKLPRVLILHLKRYDIFHEKRSDYVNIVKNLSLANKILLEESELPKRFVYEKESDRTTATITRFNNGVKRKLSQSLQDLSLPQPKLSKQSLSFQMPEKIENTCDANDQSNNVNNKSFTKLQDARRELDFTKTDNHTSDNSYLAYERSSSNKFDEFSKSIRSLSDNEDEFQRVLELSKREYEEQQKKDLSQFHESKSQQYSFSLSHRSNSTSNLNNSNDIDNNHNGSNHDSQHNSKDLTSVLDISGDDLDTFSTVYNLVGIVNHHGLNTQSGHYTCDCYDFKSKQWRTYDDSSVKDLSEYDVLDSRSNSGYIVFYMHTSCYDSIDSSF